MNTTNEVNTTQEGAWIDIHETDVPDYARTHQPENIDSLAADMGKNGQLQNVVLVKKVDGRYECIIGNGRLEAAKKLGWEKIRADVKEGLTDGQKLLMTLAENNEREAASPVYTAQLYSRLMKAEGLDQRGLAARLGKDESLIGKYLSLNGLASEVQENWKRFQFGIGICLELAKLPKAEDQARLAQECADKDYSVRELQARVKKLLHPAAAKAEAPKSEEPEGPFQFISKGKGLVIRAKEKPTMDLLDVYVQDFRCAVIDYLAQEKQGVPAAA
jgi:ParB family chromosome partitioning protein